MQVLQILPDQNQYLWHPSGEITIGFSLQWRRTSQIKDILMEFNNKSDYEVRPRSIIKLKKPQGTITLWVPHPGQYSLEIVNLVINGVPQPPLTLEITVVSPFNHWRQYESKNKQILTSPKYCFPKRLKNIRRYITPNTNTRTLWLYGVPGCGKTFFTRHYLCPALEDKGYKVILVEDSSQRWQILAEIAKGIGMPNKAASYRFDYHLQDISWWSKWPRSIVLLLDGLYKRDKIPDVAFELIHLALNPPNSPHMPDDLRVVVTSVLSFEEYVERIKDKDPDAAQWLQEQIRTKEGFRSVEMNLWSEEDVRSLIKCHLNKELPDVIVSQLYELTAGHPYLLAASLDTAHSLYEPGEIPFSLEPDAQFISERAKYLLKRYRQVGLITSEDIRNFNRIQQDTLDWTVPILLRENVWESLARKGLLTIKKRDGQKFYRVTGAFTKIDTQEWTDEQ